MRTPTIHLNGDSQQRLLDEAYAAHSALDKAFEAVANITVHGRNFYPQGPEAVVEATAQRHALLCQIDAIKNEIAAYADAITDGGAK